MSFPESVDTVTLTCGPVLDADGNPRAGVKLYAIPAHHVFIAETKLRPGILSAATGADGTASLEVIATDSAGLCDIAGTTVTSFRYRIGLDDISTASSEREVYLPKAHTSVAYEDLVANTAATTPGALTSTFVAPVNVARYGAGSDKTAAQNVTAFTAAIAEATTLGRPLYIPATSGDPYLINAALDVSGLTVYGDGNRSHLRWAGTARGHVLYVNGTDTTIEGLQITSTLGRDPSPESRTAPYSAILIAPAAHRTTVRRIKGSGFDSIVNIPTETNTFTDGLNVYDVEATDVAFGVAGRGLRDATITNIRGSYSVSYADGPPPHLVYIAMMDGTVPHSTNVRINNIQAWDGTFGCAAKMTGTDGGSITGVTARNCRGLLEIGTCTDVAIESVSSFADNNSATADGPKIGSIYVWTSARINLSDAVISFASGDHGEGLWTTADVTDSIFRGVAIRAYTAAGKSAAGYALVRAYGQRNIYRDFVVNNAGTDYGTAFILKDATSNQISNPKITGAIRYGVYMYTTTSGTVLTLDPKQITTTKRAVYCDASSAEKPTVVGPLSGNEPEPTLAHYTPALNGATEDGGLEYLTSGHLCVKGTGQAWLQDADGAYNSSGHSNATCTVETGKANVEIETRIKFSGTRNGVAFRALTASGDADYLLCALSSTGAVLMSREDSGTPASIATGTAQTITTGRRYTLRVVAYGAAVEAYVDGVQVLTATLSGDLHTKFGAATRHGFHCASGPSARFRWARIRDLG